MRCKNCRHDIVVTAPGLVNTRTGKEQRALHLWTEQTVQFVSVECRFQKNYQAEKCSCDEPASAINDHIADVIVSMRRAGSLWKDIAIKTGHPIAVCMRYFRAATGEGLQSMKSQPGQEVNDADKTGES